MLNSLFYTDRLTEFGNCADNDVRLVNGSNPLEGRVEVCLNNAWGTICTEGASEDDVKVICRQIGRLPDGIYIIAVEHKYYGRY